MAQAFGFDEASWLPTALNMAMMFSGVFVVFLSVAFGPRKILLTKAAIFSVASALLPFALNYRGMLALVAIAGLSSGTFYSLTMRASKQRSANDRPTSPQSRTNRMRCTSRISRISASQAGTLGTAAGSLVPAQNVVLPQGQKTLFSSGTMISQPLTPLIRIHQANRIAAAEVAVSKNDLKNAENQIALQVHNLHFGILIACLQKQAAEEQSSFANENLRESEDAVRNGSALKVASIQGRAGLLESRQAVLTAELQVDDLTTELNDLLGLPLDTQLELDPTVPAGIEQRPREEYVQTAWSDNPEIQAAEEAIRKAQAGVIAAKFAYIPDITAFARQSYQDGVPFFVRNFGTFGVNLNWEVLTSANAAPSRKKADRHGSAKRGRRGGSPPGGALEGLGPLIYI